MNIRTSAIRSLAILSLGAFALAACDKKDEIIIPPTPTPAVEVVVTPTAVTLAVGQSAQAGAVVKNVPTGGSSSVSWTSSASTVASVDATGKITAVAPGSALITATSAADANAKGFVSVTVTAPVVTITLLPGTLALTQGQTSNLSATVTGSTNTNVNYSSNATGVATVSATGVVTAVGPGTAVITAASAADPTKTAQTVVTVTGTTANVQISLAPATATVTIGGTQQFVPNVTGTSNTAVTYRTSDAAVATVTTGGLATGVGAGTAVITAIASADTTKKATAVLTVNALPAITLTVTPTTITNLGAGATTQILATVTGSSNQAVTCTSANTAVATVTASGNACSVKGVAAGSTVITIVSAADNTKVQTVPVTVVGASVAIANIPASPAAGNFIINANVSVPAGTADSLMIKLTNTTTGTVYTVRCQTFTAAGAATTVACPINPADLDPNTAGAQVLPNGTYTISAVLLQANNVAATATFGTQLTTGNANTLAGTVTFSNTTANTDNTPASAQAINAGVIWNGGTATVVVAPSVFTGTAIANLTIAVDLNCDGVVGAAEPQRVVAAAADGTFTATFSETVAPAAAGGIEGVTGPICFIAGNGTAANTLPVTVAAGAGTGQISSIGTAAPAVLANALNVDNVPPVYGALALPPSMTAIIPWPVLNWAGSGTAFATTGADAVPGTPAVDAGVNTNTTTFYAVTTGTAVATQANMAAATASLTPITTAADLPASTTANNAYTLIVKTVDALGNTIYGNAGTFGVDKENPTIVADATSIAASGSINNAAQDIVANTTDAFSGPVQLKVTGVVYSVLEVDADAGTEMQCVAAGGVVVALPAGGACAPFYVGLANIGGTTEQGTALHPNPAGTTEGYYEYTVQAVDRAGNLSTALTYNMLNDVTVPASTIATASFDYVAGTVSLTGTINENVDLKQYDTRFTFTGLGGVAGVGAAPDVPDQVPFVAPTAVDSYGLPLTGVVAVSAANSTNVKDIRDATGTYASSQFGIGAVDVAANYAFNGLAITPAAGAGVLFGTPAALLPTANFNAGFNAAGTTNAQCIDRSGNGGAGCPASTTFYTQVTTGPTDANPIATIYYYIVNPGLDGVFQTADDYNVLVGTAAGSTASVQTGITERTWTFSTAISTAVQPRIGSPTAYPMFAIGVASNGSAIMSDVVVLTIQD